MKQTLSDEFEVLGRACQGVTGEEELWLLRRRLPRSRLPRRPPRRPRRRSNSLLFNRFVSSFRSGVLWNPGVLFYRLTIEETVDAARGASRIPLR